MVKYTHSESRRTHFLQYAMVHRLERIMLPMRLVDDCKVSFWEVLCCWVVDIEKVCWLFFAVAMGLSSIKKSAFYTTVVTSADPSPASTAVAVDSETKRMKHVMLPQGVLVARSDSR